MKKRGQRVYRKLLLEDEEEGLFCTMCDRFAEIETDAEGETKLRVRRADKNTP